MPRLTRQTTAQMPRKIFNVSHVAKFAAACQANRCSNAAQNIECQLHGKVCRGVPGKPLLKCRARYSISITSRSFAKPSMWITDKMPRKIFFINHVAKFAAAYQTNHCSYAAQNILYQPRGKVCRGLPGKPPLKCPAKYWVLAKFAAAYLANHCSNAAQNILNQPRGKVWRGLQGKPLLKCRAKYSISTMWQSFPRPSRQTTAQMPRKIFFINHVAKFYEAYYENHFSNAAQNSVYQPRVKPLHSSTKTVQYQPQPVITE